jgi:uncharacterized membrane protein
MPDVIDPSPPEPLVEGSEEPGVPPNVAGCLACVFPLVGGLVFLSIEKKNAFVRYYAMQSVYFGGASFVAYVVLHIVWWIMAKVPFVGGLLSLIFSTVWMFVALLWVAVYLILIVKAISGKEWEIPYVGALARRQLAVPRPAGGDAYSKS